MPMSTRGSKACSICHQKKIKCDLASGIQPCTNCQLGDYTCRPHQRKRKHYSLSPSPSRDTSRARRSSHRASIGTYHTAGSESDFANATIEVEAQDAPTVATSHHSVLPPDDSASEVPTAAQSYVGRLDYIGGQVRVTEDATVHNVAQNRDAGLSPLDIQVLTLQKALELPPRAVRESLIDAYMERCQPWMPIVERRWLEDTPQRQASLLLLQAVFLAGSRVLSSPMVHTSSEEFFDRARALFFHGHEKNTTLAVVAVCLLQWWNPTGPERFSTSTSGFWVRIGFDLAYQAGLHREPPDGPFKGFRRRLWWTLVSRDNLISVGTGRPRTINLEDSNVKPPALADFPVPNFHASLFISYVSINKQIGDIAEAQRRQTLTPSCKQRLEDALFRWTKELSPQLRIMHHQDGQSRPTPYNFEARQLAVPYFVSLILLHRSSNPHAPVSTVCLVAASFVATFFEEFLSRDQLRYPGPVFAFFALAAGVVQLSSFRYESLRDIAEHEFNVIKMSLEELGKRYGSARSALRALNKAKEMIEQQGLQQGHPPLLTEAETVFFADFGSGLCPMWHAGFGKDRNGVDGYGFSTPRPAQMWDVNAEDALPGDSAGPAQNPYVSAQLPSVGNESVADIYGDAMEEDLTLFDDPLGAAEGSWLFDNWDIQGILADAVNTGA